MELPKKGIYRHFKGKRYELLDFAKHSETTEIMVVYRALYGENDLWVRPLSMWNEIVERDGHTYTRFLPEEEYLRIQADDEGFDQMIPPPEQEDFDSIYEEIEPVYVSGTQEDKHQLLKRVYGYESFREGQEDVIDSIMAGKDTLAILPTGAGKSICYQLPAQMLEGVALVVSPLISLMKDQVNVLTQAGIPAAYLNSSLTERQFDAALNRLVQGKYKIVYAAPERLLTPRFLNAVNKVRISMVAVDEAHCISQWGQDFRPSYLEIPAFLEKLPVKPRLCAFTATATNRVKEDIVRLLEMKQPYIRITGFNRSNLYFSVFYTHEKEKKLLELLNSYRGFSGIIYCGTRKLVESVHEKLLVKNYPATRYHAGLSETERVHNQEDFIYDRSPIMVATNAFGMGIDKSNVRFVIHYNMPKDLESYYQEAGRAGRDGERADCHLLFEPRDIVLQSFFIDKIGEENEMDPTTLAKVQENARLRLHAMVDYCKTTRCLRRTILRYFGEEQEGKCDYCSNCLDPRNLTDVTAAARLFVSCVRKYNGRFGARLIIDVLRGSENNRVSSFKLDRSEYHGVLSGITTSNLQYLLDALVENEILEITTGDYPLLRCGRKADDLLDGLSSVHAYQQETTPKKNFPEKEADQLAEDIDGILFEKLWKARLRIARVRSIPPYVVCADSVLVDMCRKLPTDKGQMIFVKGMGERKIASYGDEFAKVIRNHLENAE